MIKILTFENVTLCYLQDKLKITISIQLRRLRIPKGELLIPYGVEVAMQNLSNHKSAQLTKFYVIPTQTVIFLIFFLKVFIFTYKNLQVLKKNEKD